MGLTMSLIKADIIAALQAVDYYNENSKVKDIKNIAAYHLQQAAEKLIKIQIYAKSKDLNYASLYTHNIEKLLAYSETLDIDLIVPKYIKDNSLILTEWETGSRYDVDFQIKVSALRRALKVISEWYDKVYDEGIREA